MNSNHAISNTHCHPPQPTGDPAQILEEEWKAFKNDSVEREWHRTRPACAFNADDVQSVFQRVSDPKWQDFRDVETQFMYLERVKDNLKVRVVCAGMP